MIRFLLAFQEIATDRKFREIQLRSWSENMQS